jgi:RND family efflux transporter MFP subunit
MSTKLVYILLGAVFSLGAASVDNSDGFNFVFDPIERTIYYPQVQVIAPVVKLEKKADDSFKKGELLLQTDPIKYEAQVMKWRAEFKKAVTEFTTRERLFNDGNGSYFDYENAKAALEDAKANLEISLKNLEATTIFAPYDGKVAAMMIEKTAIPVETLPLMELINEEILIAKILLPSQLSNSFKLGDSVFLKVFETGDEIEAQVTRIGAVIDPMSSTIKIDAEVINKEHKWKSGMHGIAEFKDQSNDAPEQKPEIPIENEDNTSLHITNGFKGESIVLYIETEYHGEFSGSVAFSTLNNLHSEQVE